MADVQTSPGSDRMEWSPSGPPLVYYQSRFYFDVPATSQKRGFDQISDGIEPRGRHQEDIPTYVYPTYGPGQDQFFPPDEHLGTIPRLVYRARFCLWLATLYGLRFAGRGVKYTEYAIKRRIVNAYDAEVSIHRDRQTTPRRRKYRNIYTTPPQRYNNRSPRSIKLRDIPGRFPSTPLSAYFSDNTAQIDAIDSKLQRPEHLALVHSASPLDFKEQQPAKPRIPTNVTLDERYVSKEQALLIPGLMEFLNPEGDWRDVSELEEYDNGTKKLPPEDKGSEVLELQKEDGVFKDFDLGGDWREDPDLEVGGDDLRDSVLGGDQHDVSQLTDRKAGDQPLTQHDLNTETDRQAGTSSDHASTNPNQTASNSGLTADLGLGSAEPAPDTTPRARREHAFNVPEAGRETKSVIVVGDVPYHPQNDAALRLAPGVEEPDDYYVDYRFPDEVSPQKDRSIKSTPGHGSSDETEECVISRPSEESAASPTTGQEEFLMHGALQVSPDDEVDQENIPTGDSTTTDLLSLQASGGRWHRLLNEDRPETQPDLAPEALIEDQAAGTSTAQASKDAVQSEDTVAARRVELSNTICSSTLAASKNSSRQALSPITNNKVLKPTAKPQNSRLIDKLAMYFGFRKGQANASNSKASARALRKSVGFYESPKTGGPVTRTKRFVIGESMDHPSPVSSRDESTLVSVSGHNLGHSPTPLEQADLDAQLHTFRPSTSESGSISSSLISQYSSEVSLDSAKESGEEVLDNNGQSNGHTTVGQTREANTTGAQHKSDGRGTKLRKNEPKKKKATSAAKSGNEEPKNLFKLGHVRTPDQDSGTISVALKDLSLDVNASPRRARTRQFDLRQKEAEEKAERERKEAEEKAKREEEERAEREREAEDQRQRFGVRRLTKQPIIGPLLAEWDSKVDDAMSKSLSTQIAMTSAGNPITRRDFGKVLPQAGTTDDPAGWLNDEVIDAYLQAVVDLGHSRLGYRRGTPKLHAFNPFFFTNLKKPGGYDNVKRWARRAKIGGKDLLDVEWVFIPVNHGGAHWTLAVVSPVRKTIEYFDSMHGQAASVMATVCSWIKGELGSAYVEEEWIFRDDESGTHTGRGKGPTQNNGSDCGVFTITTAKMLTLGIDPLAVQASDMPLQRRRIVAELMNGGFSGDFEPVFEFA